MERVLLWLHFRGLDDAVASHGGCATFAGEIGCIWDDLGIDDARVCESGREMWHSRTGVLSCGDWGMTSDRAGGKWYRETGYGGKTAGGRSA